MQSPLHVELGYLNVNSEDSRRLLGKQCHSETVYWCKIYDVALHHDCGESFHVRKYFLDVISNQKLI